MAHGYYRNPKAKSITLVSATAGQAGRWRDSQFPTPIRSPLFKSLQLSNKVQRSRPLLQFVLCTWCSKVDFPWMWRSHFTITISPGRSRLSCHLKLQCYLCDPSQRDGTRFEAKFLFNIWSCPPWVGMKARFQCTIYYVLPAPLYSNPNFSDFVCDLYKKCNYASGCPSKTWNPGECRFIG